MACHRRKDLHQPVLQYLPEHLWLTVTGGKAMSVLLVTRVPKNLILLPIEIVLVYFGMKLVNRIYGALPNGKAADGNQRIENGE